MNTFTPFQKIPRLLRTVVVTEKIDGTNASISIEPAVTDLIPEHGDDGLGVIGPFGPVSLKVGSRNRWITPTSDNFGFAKFVYENAPELVASLGVGMHFGEWWGPGIQRGYGLPEKRFSLFNTARWADRPASEWPARVGVVPVLYTGEFDTDAIKRVMEHLQDFGSAVSPGFMRPEGVVVYHTASRQLFKYTLDGDAKQKGAQDA